MSIKNNPTDTTRGQGGHEASGQHQGLHRPNDDQRVEQALHDVGLQDQGDVVEDQLRDRRGSGIPAATDDVGGDRSDDERDEGR